MPRKTNEELLAGAEKNIKKAIYQSVPIIFAVLLIPFLSANSFQKPMEEAVSFWFQRSGSLMVLLAVWVEFRLFKVSGDIFPSGLFLEQEYDLGLRYRLRFNIIKYTAVIGALIGTVIWGYGDILYQEYFKYVETA